MTRDRVRNNSTQQQRRMESFYQFPYHYIPTWDGKLFSQAQLYPWSFEYLAYLHFVIDKLRDLTFSSLLDVGCGDGRFLKEMRRLYADQYLVGIDYSIAAIRLAQALVPQVNWVHGDITNEFTPLETFDVITLIETLEHIPMKELPGFINGIWQHLNDHGQFLLTVPSTNVPVTAHHVQHFNYQSLSELLNPSFVIEEVSYLNRNWKILRKMFVSLTASGHIILNNSRMLGIMFSFYQKHFLVGSCTDSRRLFLRCTKRNSLEAPKNDL